MSPDHNLFDAELAALLSDTSDAPADFGFTARLMDRVAQRQRTRRLVFGGAGLAAMGVVIMVLAGPAVAAGLTTLGGLVVVLSVTGLALGGLGYAMAEV